jgi:serralysin
MKKSYSLPEDAGVGPSFDFGDDAAMPPPAAVDDGLIFDEGEPFALASTTTSGSVSAGSAKPVATIATLADYLVNGFWQYNSSIAHHWASSTVTYNITGLNAAEQFLAQTALQAWHEVANITFVQTTGTANITFVDTGSMQAVTNASWYGNGAMASANVDISADWITNDGGAMDGKTGIDSYGYQTYIHEIGHALGLGHQGPYNGSAVYSTNALYADDTWQYSVMSYFAQNNYSGSTYRYVVSPQEADIYAVGQMYGAATTTRTGNTVYGFHSNAGAVYDFSAYTRAPALTIYDSGGNDTLDCSGYSVAQTVDLHAGAFSSVGGLVNNIGIALGTNIENAIGGSGNDTLIANDNACTLTGGAGNDTLIGGAGNDRLIGGTGVDIMTGNGGADTFVFVIGDSSPASGQHDRITDFVSGTDHIDLSGIDAIVSTAGVDQFRFIGNSAFDGSAGELDYAYNSTLGVTTVQGDTNGDRVADFAIDLVGNVVVGVSDFIGAFLASITVVEAQGSIKLDKVGSNYYFDPVSGGTGPVLKFGGTAYVDAQPWAAIGVEHISNGYEVAWHNTSTGLYTIWNTDSSGNMVSTPISGVSGTSAALESAEVSFQQDLNGDGVIGLFQQAATIIEQYGSTKLSLLAANYYFDPVGGGTGQMLKYGGVAYVDVQPWTVIGVEQTASGFEVAWHNTSTNVYTVWNTDSTGDFASVAISGVSGTSMALESVEVSFQQDLNGDGVIGLAQPAGTVIEHNGSTALQLFNANYYFNPVAGGMGPTLKYGGVAYVDAQPWVAVGVEQTASGYEVAWHNTSTDLYTSWNTDSTGNFVSVGFSGVLGTSAALESAEVSFQQDLNGDGVVGLAQVAGTLIEHNGSTALELLGSNYRFDPVAGGTGPTLKYGGVAYVDAQPWTAIGVEQTASGYEVAWLNTSTNLYTVWNTDNGGNLVSRPIVNVSGTDAALQAIEVSFQQDLNHDGTIGALQQLIAQDQQFPQADAHFVELNAGLHLLI